MANIMELRVAAFINEDWIHSHTDPYYHYFFEGNNRDFTYWTENDNKLIKQVQHIVINWNTSLINVYKAVGPTRMKTLDWRTGTETIQSFPLTSDQNITYNNTVLTPTSASLYIRGSSNNPAIPGSPPIDWEYNISVDRNSGQVTFIGQHDGYPNHEIYKRIDGETPVELYRFYKKTLGHLFDPMDINVNFTK
ncbi:DUF3238 domain-containing protein [Paenibacillus sp. MZ04-78.2]|uniref:DUF3238 domain-containing protein n=1 Tax=Paenibacillus sp. MZ04-78.2 TaxID=2962034 RepID=UPI0020B71F6A|nr:DUF3238 domain-containing protein [Paenibacillus sp. MZ04-78.2]MCP3774860.1 DUF3238 domain-containing protein [Paenibacillus sp. MZ04-78.2]